MKGKDPFRRRHKVHQNIMRPLMEGCVNAAGPPLRMASKHGQLVQLLHNSNVLRLVGVLRWPLGRIVAIALLVGKPVTQLYLELQVVRRRVTGWMLAPVRSPRLRRLVGGLFELRRWHVALGAS